MSDNTQEKLDRITAILQQQEIALTKYNVLLDEHIRSHWKLAEYVEVIKAQLDKEIDSVSTEMVAVQSKVSRIYNIPTLIKWTLVTLASLAALMAALQKFF